MAMRMPEMRNDADICACANIRIYIYIPDYRPTSPYEPPVKSDQVLGKPLSKKSHAGHFGLTVICPKDYCTLLGYSVQCTLCMQKHIYSLRSEYFDVTTMVSPEGYRNREGDQDEEGTHCLSIFI